MKPSLGDALRFAWELPQNLLGVSLLCLEYAAGSTERVELERGRLLIQSKNSAVSLGFFVFWSRESNRWFTLDDTNKQHELGHSFQSRMLGPLYLPLVGVPSALRALYAVGYREVTGARWQRYYEAYPESWADRLGGVDRRASTQPAASGEDAAARTSE